MVSFPAYPYPDRHAFQATLDSGSLAIQADGEECNICREEFDHEHQAIRLHDGHIFGKECIKPWLAEHDNCPKCRKVIFRPSVTARRIHEALEWILDIRERELAQHVDTLRGLIINSRQPLTQERVQSVEQWIWERWNAPETRRLRAEVRGELLPIDEVIEYGTDEDRADWVEANQTLASLVGLVEMDESHTQRYERARRIRNTVEMIVHQRYWIEVEMAGI